MYKIFIDGQAGTTGLQIHQQLQDRADLELLRISDADRKNIDTKRQIIIEADVVILCLPDKAAIETVQLAPLDKVRFIDASTAHRTNKDWVYGLPEMNDTQRSLIQSARLVSNPGCFPTGFLLPVIPLIEQAWLNPSSRITCSAISGYSGGGRKLVAAYEQQAREKPDEIWHSRPYSLQLAHKHIGEMQHFAKLDTAPLFLPSVGHFAQGMLVSIGLFSEFFFSDVNPDQVYELLASTYSDEPCINVFGPNDESQLLDGFLDPQANNGTNSLDIFVFGHAEQILLVCRLDNLGKGACGAAIQNLNLMLGKPELEGLSL
ncbi:MAG: N-acetyl-gamma-glutamyl-phosphate reductase [Gammaproteobacteria bacterium]|nr:N-acetyl-gamma-glutamyl-phosphate reductase [Gammaproteobacteria bacterium]